MGSVLSGFFKRASTPISTRDEEISTNSSDRPVCFDQKPAFMKGVDEPKLTAVNSNFVPQLTANVELQTYRDSTSHYGPIEETRIKSVYDILNGSINTDILRAEDIQAILKSQNALNKNKTGQNE